MSYHATHVTYATVCIGNYLQSVLRYKFLGLDVCHLPAPCLCEQGSEDSWLFFEARNKTVCETLHWATEGESCYLQTDRQTDHHA
jgi:hypothetical protein